MNNTSLALINTIHDLGAKLASAEAREVRVRELVERWRNESPAYGGYSGIARKKLMQCADDLLAALREPKEKL